jgi:hypothetical protein
VNSTRFSPIKTLAISLALALGILVSDLVGRSIVPTTRAQDSTECSQKLAVESVPVGTAVAVSEGMLKGGTISARGVLVSGDEVDGVFTDDVRLINGVLVSGDDVLADGYAVSDEGSRCDAGTIVGGRVLTSYGVLVSGDETADDEDSAATWPALQIVGGTVEGDNVRVENGVILGDNLRVVGGYVVGRSLRLSGAGISVQIAPME